MFIRAGALSASVTLMQAFWKTMKEGEARTQLIRRTVRALAPETRGPLIKAYPCVSGCIHDVSSVIDDGEQGATPATSPPAATAAAAAEQATLPAAGSAAAAPAAEGPAEDRR